MAVAELSFKILGERITPERVREVIKKASQVKWGKHLLKWRYGEVEHEGGHYKNGMFIPADQWHLLKRIYIDSDWGNEATIATISEEAGKVVRSKSSQIWVYGYYRTFPPRLQWAFYSKKSKIVVVYDEQADLIATVFKVEVATEYFLLQHQPRQINRKKWRI